MDLVPLSKTFFAILAICVFLIGAVLVVLAAVNKIFKKDIGGQFMSSISPQAATFIFLVTGTAMAGSLYYSEVVGYIPCQLCWYQRIAMYSLAITSLVATIRKEPGNFRPYGLALALVGICVSIYHTWLQAFPRATSFCSVEAPCSERHIWELGFVSLPFMALSAFLFTIGILVSFRKVKNETR
jgi:disulfide bond formation protein DsbB